MDELYLAGDEGLGFGRRPFRVEDIKHLPCGVLL